MVKNIFTKESKVAFILESPYTDEIESGYPLAGDSGKEIATRVLGTGVTPLGKICKEGAFDLNQLNPFSIVNISRFPLEQGAYNPAVFSVPENMEALETLKCNIDRQHKKGTNHEHWVRARNQDVMALKNELLNECIANIKRLIQLNKNIYLIPCGKFARVFVNKSLENNELKGKCSVVNGFPHPARNQWSNLPESKLNELKSLVILPSA